MRGTDSYIGYNQLDLTGIKQIEIMAQATTRVGASGGVVEVRLGSPTGKLIGTTSPVVVKDPVFGPPPAATAPANGSKPATPPAAAPAGGGQRRQMGQQAVAKIEATEGFHDVYFVFKNPNAQPNQILMSVSTIQFQNTAPNL